MRPGNGLREWGTVLPGAGVVGFAALLGGWQWAGLVACLVGGALHAHQRQLAAISARSVAQDSLAGLLHGPGLPEELGSIQAEQWSERRLLEFLEALKETCGGEMTASAKHPPSAEQRVPVAPGIAFALSHDAGMWWAQLTLKGEASRRFLHGGPAQWHSRGASPSEAIEALLAAVAASRKASLVQRYAERVLEHGE